MHTMQNTPKILSVLGSVLDFLGVFGILVTGYIFKYVLDEEFFEDLVPPEDMGEIQQIVDIYQFVGNVMMVLGLILAVIFIINLVNNLRLILGKYTESQARVAYTFQLFIGIVLILLNTVAGIVYIISGMQGRNNEPDKIKTREGI